MNIRRLINGLGAIGLLLAAPAFAIDESDILDYGDAFRISARALDDTSVEIRWDIEPNHYMYRRFLNVDSATPGIAAEAPIVPAGKKYFDELLEEEVETYREQFVITVPVRVTDASVGEFDLRVRSQGCVENILCYPPTVQMVSVRLSGGAADAARNAGAPDSSDGGSALDTLLGPIGNLPGVEQTALAPEQAFVYEAIAVSAETLLVRFTAEDGYYLYRDKFAFRVIGADGFVVRRAQTPPGTIKDDPEFGSIEVYFGQVEIPVRLNRPAGPEQTITLQADFQGCRDGDICYPPMTREVSLSIPEAASAIGGPVETGAQIIPTAAAAAPVTEQDRLARMLNEHTGKALAAFFIAGLLLAFTPCVFPMIPILSGIIAGQGETVTTRKAFTLSLIYVLAMAVTYTVIGVIAGLFGKNLQAIFQNPWVLSGFALIFVLLALSMFGFYELQLPGRWQSKLSDISNRQRGGSLTGVAVMGLLSALIVGPCVAPPLMAALIVIGQSGDAVLGGSALFALAMGMGVPLLIIGTSAGQLLPRAGKWMDMIKAVFGVGLLALSIWLLERILPGGVVMLLWGALAIACAVYLGALERIPDGASGWRRLWKALGVLLLLLGGLQVVGALSGGDDWQRPLAHWRTAGGGASAEAAHVEFRLIKTEADLESALAAAGGKPTMLDFYADWCVECKRMEKTTFRDPRIVDALSGAVLLQADVTAFDEEDEALVQRFGLYGPPAILFFDPQGRELSHVRMIGYMNADDFLGHLDIALQ